MNFRISALALAAAFGILATGVSAQTVGEQLETGHISESAFHQLIATTGLTPDEARDLTVDEIVAVRWQDD